MPCVRRAARPSLPPLRAVRRCSGKISPGITSSGSAQRCSTETSEAVERNIESKGVRMLRAVPTPHPSGPARVGARGSPGERSPRLGPLVTLPSCSCIFYLPNQPIPLSQSRASDFKPPVPTPCLAGRGRGAAVPPRGHACRPGRARSGPAAPSHGRRKRPLDRNETSASLRFGHLVSALLSSDILNKYKESLALLSSIRLHDRVEPSDFHQSSIK